MSEEKYIPTLDDKLTFLGLTARQSVSAIKQAYGDSKISKEAYIELFQKNQIVFSLISALQQEMASDPRIPYFEGFVKNMGRDMSQETSKQEASDGIVEWAIRFYEPVKTNEDEMAYMRRAGLIDGIRVDLISIEPVDDMWKARLAMAGGRFDIIVTFWLDDTHTLEENLIHIEHTEEAPGTDVPPLKG